MCQLCFLFQLHTNLCLLTAYIRGWRVLCFKILPPAAECQRYRDRNPPRFLGGLVFGLSVCLFQILPIKSNLYEHCLGPHSAFHGPPVTVEPTLKKMFLGQ